MIWCWRNPDAQRYTPVLIKVGTNFLESTVLASFLPDSGLLSTGRIC